MRARARRILRWAALGLVLSLLLAAGLGAGLVWWYGRGLEDVDVAALERWTPPQTTRVLAADGTVIGELHGAERRVVVPLERIPAHVQDAFLAAEDADFFTHGGTDLLGMARAAWVNVRTGSLRQGASTITQQVIKNLLLSPERTLARKSRELVLAGRVERALGKARILEIYLNLIYLGHGRYGVEAASRYYFGVGVAEIDVGQAAVLAALPKAPGRVTPYLAPERVKARQRWVLGRMVEEGMLDAAEAERHLDAPLPVRPDPTAADPTLAPEVLAHVRARLLERYGEAGLATLGAEVHTSLDPALQRAARQALVRGTDAVQARHDGAKAPPEGAVLLADVDTGAVRAWVGGREGRPGMFDRASRARRQPASAFKPLVYGAALAGRLITPATLVPGGSDGALQTVRRALARSSNAAARAVFERVGPEAVHAFARAVGIVSPLHTHPSLALGTAEVTPLELLSAYATLAAGGEGRAPRVITKVALPDGTVWRPEAVAPAGVDPAAVHVLTSVMESVVQEGTGRAARELGRPLAGKTGTSDEARDAWFAGFSRDRVAVVWIGHDRGASLGERASGAKAALPVWIDVMTEAHVGRPARAFEAPPGVERVALDRDTLGPACRVRARRWQPERCEGWFIFQTCEPAGFRPAPEHLWCSDPGRWFDEVFLAGTAPTEPAREAAAGAGVRIAGLSLPLTAPTEGRAELLAPLVAWRAEIDRAARPLLRGAPPGRMALRVVLGPVPWRPRVDVIRPHPALRGGRGRAARAARALERAARELVAGREAPAAPPGARDPQSGQQVVVLELTAPAGSSM